MQPHRLVPFPFFPFLWWPFLGCPDQFWVKTKLLNELVAICCKVDPERARAKLKTVDKI